MPKLTVESLGTFEVATGKRLVNALVEDANADQLHACGGFARCTTCRVEFIAGEPVTMSQAEKDVLTAKGLINTIGLRLSCQVICEHDMEVKVISRFEGSGRVDAGKPVPATIDPPPVYVSR